MKKVVILGKPNVGKSSLFNRILKKQEAITSDVSGTTRDIKKKIATIGEKEIELIDTGGLEEKDELFSKVKIRSLNAAKEADIILYVVDGKKGLDDEDRKLFFELLKQNKKIALVVNKIDNDKLEENVWDFYSFGTKNIFPISVAHNRKVSKLLDWIEKVVPDKKELIILEDDDLDIESFL
ncbi:MAG TPA: GTP-binding protein, partial [Campylobacterales bacterium]|nr:GTP-binding protein [Campylobacterales bacterium]